MIGSETLFAYLLILLGLFLIPGPAVLLILTRSVGGGRRVGVATALGIMMGDFVHTLMATFGLSAVLATSAIAFSVVKFAGASYLIYLGVRSFFEKGQLLEVPTARRLGSGGAFRQGMVTETLNPKTALFFLAFLPQFVHPERGSAIGQLALLGLIFVVLSAAYCAFLAVSAGSLSPWLTRHRAIGRWQGKVVGTIYLGLGVRLALQER
jgi:threonine/homoserine/homoserine lactone efflux protein